MHLSSVDLITVTVHIRSIRQLQLIQNAADRVLTETRKVGHIFWYVMTLRNISGRQEQVCFQSPELAINTEKLLSILMHYTCRCVSTLASFKSDLKTFLFTTAFNQLI